MRVLILGGTRFVGRHIVEAMLAAGHKVTILSRGQSPDELPASVERLRGDRDAGVAGLEALSDRNWDVCIDVCGYTPRQVRPSAELLRNHVGRYVIISAVRVYGDPEVRPVRETHSLLPPAPEDVTEIDDRTYGPLKVACEQIVQQTYGDWATVLRPQVVVGPHDPSGRFTYWLDRAARGGEMLVPGDGSDYLQVIDARDVARFVATVLEIDLGGAFNLSGPRITWAEFIDILGVQKPVWVSAEILRGANLTFADLPLYRPKGWPFSSLMEVSNERAVAAGLKLTDLAITVRDTRARSAPMNMLPALPIEREVELIQARHGETP